MTNREKFKEVFGFIPNDDECMCKGEDKEFIRMVLNKWVDEMEVDG